MPARVLDLPVAPADFGQTATATEGGRAAKATLIASQVGADKDRHAHGRRVLAQVGLHGADAFLVKSIDPEDTPSQEYPEKAAERVLLRTRARLTPGYALQVHVTYSPTGQTQYFLAEPSNSWFPDGAIGALLVDVSWYTPLAVEQTTSNAFGLAPSGELYAGIGATPWLQVREFTSPVITCEGQDINDARFSEWVTVTITLTARGGARIIDAVVYEVPHRYARSDSYRETTVQSGPPVNYYSYAILAPAPPTDARHGPRAALHIMDSRRHLSGPALMQWSSWDESSEAVTVDEATPVSVSGLSFTELRFPSISTFAESHPGWSLSSGGTARHIEHSGTQALRGKDGVIPVTCRVYARMTTGGDTGTIRFQSKDYSLCDIDVTINSWFWFEAVGYLRCGPHQSVSSVMQILGKVAGIGTTLQVRYAAVDFGTCAVPNQ